MWHELGYRENPYSTDPVPPNEEGMGLLVGREKELAQLKRILTSSNNHPTIEGSNGVGKTSLVGIAAYKLFQDYLDNPQNSPLFIPVQTPFQISPTETPENFTDRFMITLAREVTSYRAFLDEEKIGRERLIGLDKWLNDPIFKSTGGGVSVAGFGGSLSSGSSANTGQGFVRGGVETHLREMLAGMFPLKRGGFVCVLDNLELLDTSGKARATLEALRDGVFAIPGIKWVLCGARGIVRSVVSTPRLQGKLSNPIELAPLGPENVKTAIERRLQVFKIREDAYTPVDVQGFAKIYEICNRNLRISLKYCEDFVFWCIDHENRPQTEEDKLSLLDVWFAQAAEDALRDTSEVGGRAWEVFEEIAKRSEGISPGDYEALGLGLNSSQALQPHLRALELATLIESTTDDTDKRRKTINLTPRGWIVRYHRSGYKI